MGGVIRALSPLAMVTGAFKKPKVPGAAPAPTRDTAAEAARRDDELRRRMGAGANELTGGGAEAVTPGAKTLLGR